MEQRKQGRVTLQEFVEKNHSPESQERIKKETERLLKEQQAIELIDGLGENLEDYTFGVDLDISKIHNELTKEYLPLDDLIEARYGNEPTMKPMNLDYDGDGLEIMLYEPKKSCSERSLKKLNRRQLKKVYRKVVGNVIGFDEYYAKRKAGILSK